MKRTKMYHVMFVTVLMVLALSVFSSVTALSEASAAGTQTVTAAATTKKKPETVPKVKRGLTYKVNVKKNKKWKYFNVVKFTAPKKGVYKFNIDNLNTSVDMGGVSFMLCTYSNGTFHPIKNSDGTVEDLVFNYKYYKNNVKNHQNVDLDEWEYDENGMPIRIREKKITLLEEYADSCNYIYSMKKGDTVYIISRKTKEIYLNNSRKKKNFAYSYDLQVSYLRKK